MVKSQAVKAEELDVCAGKPGFVKSGCIYQTTGWHQRAHTVKKLEFHY